MANFRPFPQPGLLLDIRNWSIHCDLGTQVRGSPGSKLCGLRQQKVPDSKGALLSDTTFLARPHNAVGFPVRFAARVMWRVVLDQLSGVAAAALDHNY